MPEPLPSMSERPHIPWTRYWVPAHTPPVLDADGYLLEPYYVSSYTGSRIRVANADARTLDELADVPCLVLLGEPGAGKSTEIARLESPGAVRVDLGAVGGEVGFAEALSRNPSL